MKSIFLALLLSFAWIPVAPAETFFCERTEVAKEKVTKDLQGSDFVELSKPQLDFVRGVFVMLPDTPAAIPPGEVGIISFLPDGSAAILFIDGEMACQRIKFFGAGIGFLKQIGDGIVAHSGDGT